MKRAKILIYSLLLLTLACIDENPNLVNPPSESQTINVRLINLSGDYSARYLALNAVKTNNVEYGSASACVNPPMDSLKPYVVGASSEYHCSLLNRFIKSTIYTYIALPSPQNSATNNVVDTLLAISHQPDLPTLKVTTYIRFLNAYNDTTVSFKLVNGSPSGTELFPVTTYRAVPLSYSSLRAGENVLSLVQKNASGTETLVNMYKMTLDTNRQYTAIVAKNSSGAPELLLLDELSPLAKALTTCTALTETKAQVKVMNLSSAPVGVKNLKGETIESQISTKYLSDYKSVTVSIDSTLDEIQTYNQSGAMSSYLDYSLEVNKKYIVAILDSAGISGRRTLVIPEPLLNEASAGSAVVRFVNAIGGSGGLGLSFGAHNSSTAEQGYTSGETISDISNYDEVSNPKIVTPGRISASVFEISNILNLKFTGYFDLQADHNYLIIAYLDDNGATKLTLINESDSYQQIAPIQSAVFATFFNANPTNDYLNIAIPNYIDTGKVYYRGAIQISIPASSSSITYSGATFNYLPTDGDRFFGIMSSTNGNADFFTVVNSPIPKLSYIRYERYINATDDIELISVNLDSAKGENKTDNGVARKTSSNYISYDREKKLVYSISDKNTSTTLLTASNFILPLGKIYSFIISGSKSKGYKLDFQEEY